MKRLLFVVNGRSSRIPTAEFVREAKKRLSSQDFELHFFVSQLISDYDSIVQQARNLRPDVIVVVGGDGTSQLALNSLHLAGRDCYFFPKGTANDLAQHLGHTNRWADLVRAVNQNRSRQIDLIGVNNHLLATVGGLGVGAELCNRMNQRRNASPLFSKAAKALRQHTYSLLALQVILTRQARDMRVHVQAGDKSHTFQSSALLVANQPVLAKNIFLRDSSIRNDDGLCNIFALEARSPAEMVKAFVDMRRGRLPQRTHLISAPELKIDLQDGAASFFGDGEVLQTDTQFNIRIKTNALRVLNSGVMQ